MYLFAAATPSMRVAGKLLVGITTHPLMRFLDLVARTNGFAIPVADAPARVNPRDEVWTVNLFVPATSGTSDRLSEYVSLNKKIVKRSITSELRSEKTTAYLTEPRSLAEILLELINLTVVRSKL